MVLRASWTAGRRLALVARADTGERAERGLRRLRHWTGADDDLADFFARFRFDPLIGRSVRSAPHVRPWRRPLPFEVLMWAVCEQLITEARAVAIKRRIVHVHGRRHPESGLLDAPSAEMVAALSPALLQRCGLSQRRSVALIAAAREVASGRVDLDAGPSERAYGVRRLRAIPGIGAWTLAVLALHGHGDMDALPAADYAYLTLVGEVCTGRPYAKASEEEVLAFLEPYRGWRGLAGWHLLRVGSRAVSAALRGREGAIAP